MYKYKLNQRVNFNVRSGENYVGTGVIKGVVSNIEFIGVTYIVESLDSLPTESYPFTSFACAECFLSKSP